MAGTYDWKSIGTQALAGGLTAITAALTPEAEAARRPAPTPPPQPTLAERLGVPGVPVGMLAVIVIGGLVAYKLLK